MHAVRMINTNYNKDEKHILNYAWTWNPKLNVPCKVIIWQVRQLKPDIHSPANQLKQIVKLSYKTLVI